MASRMTKRQRGNARETAALPLVGPDLAAAGLHRRDLSSQGPQQPWCDAQALSLPTLHTAFPPSLDGHDEGALAPDHGPGMRPPTPAPLPASQPTVAPGMHRSCQPWLGEEEEVIAEDSAEEEAQAAAASAAHCRRACGVAALGALLCGGVAAAALYAVLGWSSKKNAAAAGVAEAWRACGGLGRPGEPAPDLHLHFLIMTLQDLPHADIWRQFFSGAPSGSYSVWVHCRLPDVCKSALADQGLGSFTVVPTVYDEGCKDLPPMIQLVRSALAQKAGSAGAPEKFVFIGDVSLPIKPFPVIRAELAKHPFASDFCVYPSDLWAPARNNTVYLVKASTWSVLSRPDAEVLVQRIPPPTVDEGVILPSLGNLSCNEFSAGCSCDRELAPFAFVFGPFWPSAEAKTYPGFGPLFLLEPPGSPLEQGCCRTWLMYGRVAEAEDVVVEEYEERVSQIGKLSRNLKDDEATVISAPTTHSAEAIYVINALGSKGLQALRESSFLFAREFASDATLEGFADAMFAK